MDEVEKLLLAIFGGILALAIISVIVSKKSRAPQAIQAFSSGLANIVSAAVNPANTAGQNGNNGSNSFSTPGTGGLSVGGLIGDINSGVSGLDTVFNSNFVNDNPALGSGY